jgi:hypothetical protein
MMGIGTGGLTAPFAFLGSRYDAKRQEVYTRISRSTPPAAAATAPTATAGAAAATLQGAALRAALLELPGTGAVTHTAECSAVAAGTLRRPRRRPWLRASPARAGAYVRPICIPNAPPLRTGRSVLSGPGAGADIASTRPVRIADAGLRAAGPVLP